LPPVPERREEQTPIAPVESLRQLVAPLVPDPSRVPERDICAVTCDSRQATSGCLFIAISGTAAEGHQFIPEAARKGAVAVVYEKAEFSELIPSEVAAVKVDSSRRAAAIIADRFWHHPTGDVNVVAVTGTNAKTTSVHLLESVFKAGGYATGMIGTLGRRLRDETVAADRTTPDAVNAPVLRLLLDASLPILDVTRGTRLESEYLRQSG